MKNKQIFLAGIIGNILDHYDTALFIYLGSVIAPLFFPSKDKMVSLIMYYGVLLLSVISRPLGSLIFSRMANKQGSYKILTITLIGTAIATFLIGFLPTYNMVGIIAPILFIIVRFIQTFFGSGEHAVAVLFLMENAEEKTRPNIGAFFNCSTMIGISFASLAGYLVAKSSDPSYYWRIAYFIGIVTSVAGIFVRIIAFNKNTDLLSPKIHNEELYFFEVIRNNFKELLIISILYIFSMITYYIPFAFMNDYINMIHPNISKSDLLRNNTIFIYYDLGLLVLIGFFFKNINAKKIIIITTASLAIFCIPAFFILQLNSFLIIELVRLIIITIGVVFASVFQAYIYQICKPNTVYTLHGTGIVIGQDFIGRLTISICLFLWYYLDNPIAPAFYIFFISLITLLSIKIYEKTRINFSSESL